jgi:hypothetical protein
MNVMKKVTLSAKERLIEQVRVQARSRQTTLNQMFREWLAGLAGEADRTRNIDEIFARCDTVNAGVKFSREEMNARGGFLNTSVLVFVFDQAVTFG